MSKIINALKNCLSRNKEETIPIIDDMSGSLSSNKYPFNKCVIEGGGVNGLAYIGVFKVFDELGITGNIKQYSCTSVGSIIGSLLAVGYTGKELERVMLNTKFEEFLDDDIGIISDAKRLLFTEFGYYKGDQLNSWLEGLYKDKLDVENITLKGLYEKVGVSMNVSVVTLSPRPRLEYMNHITHPDVILSDVVKASATPPIAFEETEINGEKWCDGGLGNNYPIDYFKDNLEGVIGLKLMTKSETRDGMILREVNDPNNIFEKAASIMTFMVLMSERMHIKEDYWKHTMSVPSMGRCILDTNVSTNDIIDMINEAYTDTIKHLTYYTKNGSFH